MVALAIFSILMAGAVGVFTMCQRLWYSISLDVETSQMANLALERIIYGAGTNGGIRAAGWFKVETNYGGHPSINPPQYWADMSAAVPKASDPNYYLHKNCSYSYDGSWRLYYSNSYEGIQYIDYNGTNRTLMFWSSTPSDTYATNIKDRLLIGNYIASASVVSNIRGCTISVSTLKRRGNKISTNTVSSFIKFRNAWAK
jgi:type II secretory pathway pseudopilin PulG